MTVMRPQEFIAQTGLANAGFTHQTHHLPTSLFDL
jgi:hypothetical protein